MTSVKSSIIVEQIQEAMKILGKVVKNISDHVGAGIIKSLELTGL
jgi:hypothetical protein